MAVIHTATKFLHGPTSAFKNLTMRGPFRASGCASPWSIVQIMTASTWAQTAPASPIHPPRIGPTTRGAAVKYPTTMSSPGAWQSHVENDLPVAPSRGMRCRSPAINNKETRVIPPIQIKSFMRGMVTGAIE